MLNPVQTSIECPVLAEARAKFRLLCRAYARRRPLVVAEAFDAQHVGLVADLVWHLGVWPALANELVLLQRMFLYDDLVEIRKQDPGHVMNFLGEDICLGTPQPQLDVIAA